MHTELCVGNLDENTSGFNLVRLFSPYGRVERAEPVVDHGAGRPRGFALVEMGSEAEAEAAIRALNGTTYAGHTISVDYPHRGPAPGQFGDRSGRNPCDPDDERGRGPRRRQPH